jgi:putative FmdB family regulatory protein
MPFYDLKCSKCGEQFNIKASLSEREQNLIKCPECGSNNLEAVFTNVNVILNRKTQAPQCPNIGSCKGCCS